MNGALNDLRQYLSRPIILFCFGVPLLLPAALLTVVAFLQNHIDTALNVLGIFFVSLAVLSIAVGMALGFQSVCRKNVQPKRPTTRGFERVEKASKKKKSKKVKLNETPESSAPNSRSSSRSSSISVGSASQILVVTNEKVRLVPRKGRKHRYPIRWNSKTPVMPSLQEEEHSQVSAPSTASISADHPALSEVKEEKSRSGNLQKLEKHLRQIGLGQDASRYMAQSPVDVEVMRPVKNPGNRQLPAPLKVRPISHSRSRSLPEQDMQKVMDAVYGDAADSAGDVIAGSARQEELLRRSARATRERQHQQQQQQQQQQQPVLTGESHERTGVRMSMSTSML